MEEVPFTTLEGMEAVCRFVRDAPIRLRLERLVQTGIYVAPSDHPITHYNIEIPNNQRMRLNGTDYRRVLAEAAADASGGNEINQYGPFPLFSQALCSNFTTINELKPEWTWRKRLVLDIDATEPGKPFIEFTRLVSIVKGWCAKWIDSNVNWDNEPIVVLGGNYGDGDKRQSFHIYFPFLCYFSGAEFVPLQHCEPQRDINRELAPFGLGWDCSLNTGILYPFTTKKLKAPLNQRKSVKVPVYVANIVLATWHDLFNVCDPLIFEADKGWDRQIAIRDCHPLDAVRPAQRVRVQAPVASAVPMSVDHEPFRARILRIYPNYGVCQFKVVVKPDGRIGYIPQTNYCPLKTEATDTPAHQHASIGKNFIYRDAGGGGVIMCHVCKSKPLYVPGDGALHAEPEIAAGLARLSTRYAKFENNFVLEYPETLANGFETEYRLMSRNDFNSATELSCNIWVINKKKVRLSEVWWQDENTPWFRFGCMYGPGGVPPGFYNTFGVHRALHAVVAELEQEFARDGAGANEFDWYSKQFEATRKIWRTNWCNDVASDYNALEAWMADSLIHPERKPTYGVAVMGPQGCGKGTVGDFYLACHGPNGLKGDADNLTNSWNHTLVSKIGVVIDEAVSNDNEKVLNHIKGLVTEKEVVQRQKYCDEKTVMTYMRFLLLSNNRPILIENKDRRWFCLQADYRIGDVASYAFKEILDAAHAETRTLRGPAAFYKLAHKFPERFVFDPYRCPESVAKWRMKFESFTPFERFIYRVCVKGFFTECFNEPKNFEFCTESANEYRIEMADLGADVFETPGRCIPKEVVTRAWEQQFPRVAKKSNDGALWKFMYSLFPSGSTAWGEERTMINGVRGYTFKMPSRAVLQQHFAAFIGQPINIFDAAWVQE